MSNITIYVDEFDNYTVNTLDDANTAIVQDYATQIDDAVGRQEAAGEGADQDEYNNLSPGEPQSDVDARVVQLFANYISNNQGQSDLDLTIDNITNIFILNGNGDGSPYHWKITNNTDHDTSLVDNSYQFSQLSFTGSRGGKVGIIHGSRNLFLDKSSGDWTVSVYPGYAISEKFSPENATGLNAQVMKALLSGGSVITGGSGTNNITVTGDSETDRGFGLVGLGSGVNNLVVNALNTTVYGAGLTSNPDADFLSDEQLLSMGSTYGTDNVTIMAGGGEYHLGSGASVVNSATVGSAITVGGGSTIIGGQGSNITFDNKGGAGFLSGATGETISALGDLSIDKGSDLNISVTGALRFVNGSGTVTLSGGANSTIWGGDALNAASTMNGYTIFTANQPGATGDQSYNATGSTGNLEYWSGPGSSTFVGGSSDNHFVFGTAFEGTSGDTETTVTGGTGTNSYGVLAGHSGGHVTIENFDPTKGDFFFEYFYKPADSKKAVDDLLATASVAGGNTTITLDNQMTVTFLGVTHLDASAFRIS